jgi:hypothetical protein
MFPDVPVRRVAFWSTDSGNLCSAPDLSNARADHATFRRPKTRCGLSDVSFRHQKKRDFFGNKHMSKMQPDAGQWLPAGVSRVPVQVGLHGSESVLILLDARG